MYSTIQYYLVVEYSQNGNYFLGFPIILCLLNCMTFIIQHGHKLTFIQLQFIFVIPCAYFGNILLPFYFPPPDLDTVVVHPFGHIFICHSSFALTMTINLHYPPNGAVDPTYIQYQSLTDGKDTDRTLHQQCLSSPLSPSPMHCTIKTKLEFLTTFSSYSNIPNSRRTSSPAVYHPPYNHAVLA